MRGRGRRRAPGRKRSGRGVAHSRDLRGHADTLPPNPRRITEDPWWTLEVPLSATDQTSTAAPLIVNFTPNDAAVAIRSLLNITAATNIALRFIRVRVYAQCVIGGAPNRVDAILRLTPRNDSIAGTPPFQTITDFGGVAGAARCGYTWPTAIRDLPIVTPNQGNNILFTIEYRIPGGVTGNKQVAVYLRLMWRPSFSGPASTSKLEVRYDRAVTSNGNAAVHESSQEENMSSELGRLELTSRENLNWCDPVGEQDFESLEMDSQES